MKYYHSITLEEKHYLVSLGKNKEEKQFLRNELNLLKKLEVRINDMEAQIAEGPTKHPRLYKWSVEDLPKFYGYYEKNLNKVWEIIKLRY